MRRLCPSASVSRGHLEHTSGVQEHGQGKDEKEEVLPTIWKNSQSRYTWSDSFVAVEGACHGQS